MSFTFDWFGKGFQVSLVFRVVPSLSNMSDVTVLVDSLTSTFFHIPPFFVRESKLSRFIRLKRFCMCVVVGISFACYPLWPQKVQVVLDKF